MVDRPILSAKHRLPLLAKTEPPCSAVSLSAIAELLVTYKQHSFRSFLANTDSPYTSLRVGLAKKLTEFDLLEGLLAFKSKTLDFNAHMRTV